MPLLPNHRALAIEATEDPEVLIDPLSRSFFHYKLTGTGEPDLVLAYETYLDPEYAHVFNALILSSASLENVTSGLGVDSRVYETYQHLFFDVTVFPHNLAKMRFVSQLDCPDEVKEYYKLAIERGASELIGRYQIGARLILEPATVMRAALSDMWGKFLTHRGFGATADTAKEALKWGESAVKVAKILMDNDQDAQHSKRGIDDLRIALDIRNVQRTVADLGISREDVVTE